MEPVQTRPTSTHTIALNLGYFFWCGMSDLQSAIAGLNTVDIEGDPIDALDACLMVLELLDVRPKNEIGEYIFTDSELREQAQKNIDVFWSRVITLGARESVLNGIRDQGKSYSISRPFNQKGLGHLSEKDQLISKTLKSARDIFFAELNPMSFERFKEKSLDYLKSSPRYSGYGKDFFDFAEKKPPAYFFENGLNAILGDFKSKDSTFGLPDHLQDWDVVKREMIDWLFANVSEAAMRDFAKNSPSDLLEKYGTIENMKAQLMRLPEPEPAQPAPQIIEHVTGRGKTLLGVVRTDLTKAQAQEIDPYTFKKDSGWFIREKYLDQAQGGAVEPQPQANTEPDFTPTASGFVHDDDNAPKPPYNKLQPSFAVERGSKMDIKYDVKESKKLLATALKEAFPGTKFGIKNTYSQYGQGYVVYWTDGPSQGMVNRILSHFISYRDGDLDHTMDYRLPGNDKAARDSDGKLVYYGLYKLDAARSLTKDFAEKLLSSLAEKRWSVNPDNPESLIADPNGEVYSITDGSGLTNHYIISPVFSGGFRINEYDYSGRGFHRKTDLIETYSDRQYGPATVVKRAKRGDLSDVPSTSDTLEPNSTTGSGRDSEQRATGSNADGSGQPESMAGSSGDRPDDGNGMQRNGGTVLPEDDGTRSGTTGDSDVSDGSGQRGTGGRANTSVSGGSSSTNGGRSSAVKRRNRAVAESATQDRTPTDLEATQRQAPTQTTWADKTNIDASLPYLLPEQRDDVLKAEQRLIDQNKAGMLFTNGTGTGKAQPLTSKILTPTGWRLMGDISVGDSVISFDGLPTKVTAVYPQGEKIIYSVVFSDGSRTECCDEHLWLTQTLYERRKSRANPNWNCAKPKVRSLQEIRASLDMQHFIPIASPVQLADQDYEIDPYILGVILGDGCITQNAIIFSSADKEIVDQVRAFLPDYLFLRDILAENRCPQYRISMKEQARNAKGQMLPHKWLEILRDIGLHGKDSLGKFVPEQYLHGSIKQRLSVLQGLMDTDGCVDKKTNSPIFTSISPMLAKAVASLVQSLGGTATIKNKKTTYTYNGCKKNGQDAYNVNINLPSGLVPFRLKRKVDLYKANEKYMPRRKIVSVEECGIKPAQCISIDHPSRLYITDDYIVTHNTFTGLGAAKRFINAGKKNILIVTMNDKIARDFVKSGNPLGIQIKQLDGIQDNGGGGAVVTTFANMGQNDSLGMIDWDLILIDEAHNLMQGEKADTTNALKKLRALSGHHSGFYDWAKMRHADKQPKPTGKDENGNDVYAEGAWDDWRTFAKPLEDEWKANWTKQSQKTKVVFLSATPFSYVKTLDWAEGYLFNFVEPSQQFDDFSNSSGGYNQGDPRGKFYMSNFGYRMRYNKLNAPDAKVNSGVMERAFAEKLKTSGAISGRLLTVKFDYDRKFILIDSEVGKQIDEGFQFLRDSKNSLGNRTYSKLSGALNRNFDYLARLQLLEAIKADAAVDMIKKHMALGRKVLVFHDYNSGGSTNPFVLDGTTDAVEKAEYDLFKKMRPDLIGLNLNLPSPIVRLKQAFPSALQFNGRVGKTERSKNADFFNADSSGPILMIAQSDAAATGISFHDTTGKHQRVLINIGMPAKPAKLRQTEGRIYRVGQASNAINRYLTTGTDWERQAFAQKIAERAETVDNLSQGEDAVVSIKDALIKSYEAAAYEDPSRSDGIGGKAYDEENARNNSLSPFDRAKTHYWAKAKERAKRGDRAGVDWYATPEPLGLKMVEWSGAHKGDDVLEPSAGDGAIGRYMPKDASVTFIEESQDLASRALMNNTDANVITDRFENHDKVNKYDCIVMNPPFGSGGATASSHVAKSVDHLRDGGRLVALLPVGQMDTRLEKMEQQGYMKDMYKVAEITLPSVTFEKAGTGVNTKVTIWQKHENQADAPQSVIRRDYSHITDVEELFDAIQDLNLPKRPPRQDEELAMYGLQIYPERKRYVITGEGLQNEKIRNIVGGYAQKDGDDFVDWRNRGKLFLKQIKEAGVKPLYPQP